MIYFKAGLHPRTSRRDKCFRSCDRLTVQQNVIHCKLDRYQSFRYVGTPHTLNLILDSRADTTILTSEYFKQYSSSSFLSSTASNAVHSSSCDNSKLAYDTGHYKSRLCILRSTSHIHKHACKVPVDYMIVYPAVENYHDLKHCKGMLTYWRSTSELHSQLSTLLSVGDRVRAKLHITLSLDSRCTVGLSILLLQYPR